jgi:hypothetical protein
MRIHSNTLSHNDFQHAARVAGVDIMTLTVHGSRSRATAWEFALSGSSPYRGGGNIGNYQGATWDEWGIFLAHLFTVDPQAHCGANSYQSAEHFNWVTGNRFATLTPGQQHKRHRWDWDNQERCVTGSYYINNCRCGAINRYVAYGHTWQEISEAV